MGLVRRRHKDNDTYVQRPSASLVSNASETWQQKLAGFVTTRIAMSRWQSSCYLDSKCKISAEYTVQALIQSRQKSLHLAAFRLWPVVSQCDVGMRTNGVLAARGTRQKFQKAVFQICLYHVNNLSSHQTQNAIGAEASAVPTTERRLSVRDEVADCPWVLLPAPKPKKRVLLSDATRLQAQLGATPVTALGVVAVGDEEK